MTSLSEESIASNKSAKRRLHEIDENIEGLNNEIDKINDFILQADLQRDLLYARLKRQKLNVLAALANNQIIVSEMEMLTAECDLTLELAKIKRNKRMKMLEMAENSQEPSTQMTSTPKGMETKSSQTDNSKNKSRKKKSSSSQKKKAPLDDTLILESLPEPNPHFPTQSTQPTRKRSPSIISNISSASEKSLNSSLASEFNRPYTNDTTDKSVKHTRTQSKSPDPLTLKTLTVTETNKDKTIKKIISNAVDKNNYSSARPKTQQAMNTSSRLNNSTPIKHSMPACIIKPPNSHTKNYASQATNTRTAVSHTQTSNSHTSSQISSTYPAYQYQLKLPMMQ